MVCPWLLRTPLRTLPASECHCVLPSWWSLPAGAQRRVRPSRGGVKGAPGLVFRWGQNVWGWAPAVGLWPPPPWTGTRSGLAAPYTSQRSLLSPALLKPAAVINRIWTSQINRIGRDGFASRVGSSEDSFEGSRLAISFVWCSISEQLERNFNLQKLEKKWPSHGRICLSPLASGSLSTSLWVLNAFPEKHALSPMGASHLSVSFYALLSCKKSFAALKYVLISCN